MGSRNSAHLRSLPRLFIVGATFENGIHELPAAELNKFRNVLRLSSGDEIAILPNDGTLCRCRLEGRTAVLVERVAPITEAKRKVTLAIALPKGDKLDDIVRMTSELGVARITVFTADRSVVRWDAKKLDDRIARLVSIAKDACSVAFRTQLPQVDVSNSLRSVLESNPNSIVLSESEAVQQSLSEALHRSSDVCLVIGPEGGWSPAELVLIGDRAATMGPRVFRVVTAAVAACSLALID